MDSSVRWRSRCRRRKSLECDCLPHDHCDRPVFGLGIVLGAIWAESAWGRFWAWDPKETVSLITWMLYALLPWPATAGWRDAKAAWINILGLATMVFNLFFINLVVSGLHSYAGLN